MVNEWTRDDLPAVMDLVKASVDAVATDPSGGAYAALDAVVEHLNAHHPKPDTDRWRRAHSIVEGERDQARRELDTWKDKWLDTYEALRQARDQWKKWEHKANEAEREVSTWRTSTESAHSDFLQAAHDRDEAVVRAEAAEARTAPAVSRADVAETLSRCINPEMWNVTFPSVVNEICDLFGIEAGQAVDPLLDKAQEFAALADWELTDREAKLLHTVARHVLGQEAKR